MLLRFFLLILLIKKSTSATNDELKEELRLVRQDIGLLKVENKNQSDQIFLLKGMVESQNKIVHEKIVEELNKKMKNCAITGNESLSSEQRQLFRILPSVHPGANTKNCRILATVVYDGVFSKSKTLNENSTTSLGRFYGQPTSCSDLSQLGYTLNGFYVVKSNNESANSSEIKLDNVFCAFQQPEGTFNPALVEKRIISRRETKPSSGKVLYFYATRKKDFEVRVGPMFPIMFDKVHVNLDNAFDATIGTFTVQKPGIYLFIFRGRVIFPQEFVHNGGILGWIYYTKNDKPLGSQSIGLALEDLNKSTNVELDKLIKLNQEDKIVVGSQFLRSYVQKFLANSTSFAVYLLEE